VPSLSVAENLALAAGWSVRPAEIRARSVEVAERFGLPLDPDAFAGRLSLALKQRLEILKALAADATTLLLDEPTAVLAPPEADELLVTIRAFVARGNSAVLITHKLPEAIAAADRVTVLRHGRVALSAETRSVTSDSLAAAMVGEEMAGSLSRARRAPVSAGAPAIRADALDIAREGRYGIAVRGASFAVRAGEIVGIAAVAGNGQRELLRAVAGVVPPLRGVCDVARPVGFIPEDRITEGLIPSLSLAQNLTLGLGEDAPWVERGRVNWREAAQATGQIIADYGIRAGGARAAAASLSGGNQQKLVIARALALGPRVIVAEEPTRGLDIAASSAVHDRLDAAAQGGAAVLFHSSDLDEVLERSHRVLVMARGVLREAPPGAGRDDVGRMMVGAA
jgi:simple sugar transport system ATP-binding protein